jgi:squalene-associated FAD-dependent desaturase
VRRAVVVGGGVAGLAAAVRLADRGREVTVLERAREAGGRIGRVDPPTGGPPIDHGQHLLLGCYRETLSLLRRLGSAPDLRPVDGPTPFVSADGAVHPYRVGALPAPLHLAPALAGLTQLSWAERALLARAVAGAVVDLRLGPDGLDRRCAEPWLAAHGQSARAIRDFWEPLVLATLNLPAAEASAFLLAVVLDRIFLGPSANARPLLPRTTLYDLFVPPAARALEARGGRVLCGRDVVRLEAGADGRIAAAACRDGERFAADEFVLAVPAWRLAALADGAPALAPLARSAAALGASPIVCVDVWYDRPWMRHAFAGVLGSTLQWVFAPEWPSERAPQRVSLVVSHAVRMIDRPEAEIVALLLEEAGRAFPSARDARPVATRTAKAVRATIRGAPGQRGLRPGPRTPLPNVVLAGDWTATDLPATIESAAASGRRAAESLG